MKSAHVERQPSKMATPAKENIWFHNSICQKPKLGLYQPLFERKRLRKFNFDCRSKPHISQSKQTTVKEKNYAKECEKYAETN